jgi:hypothetical protein
MARPIKARLEGGVSPAKVNEAMRASMAGERGDVAAIAAGVEAFKAQFPDEWDALRLCPLQHGLEVMIEKLAR